MNGVERPVAAVDAVPDTGGDITRLLTRLARYDAEVGRIDSEALVVRTGQAAPDRGFDEQVWQRIMKAAPKH